MSRYRHCCFLTVVLVSGLYRSSKDEPHEDCSIATTWVPWESKAFLISCCKKGESPNPPTNNRCCAPLCKLTIEASIVYKNTWTLRPFKSLMQLSTVLAIASLKVLAISAEVRLILPLRIPCARSLSWFLPKCIVVDDNSPPNSLFVWIRMEE
jgi:hypothetical protein